MQTVNDFMTVSDTHSFADDQLQQFERALGEQQVILDTAGAGIVFIKKRRIFALQSAVCRNFRRPARKGHAGLEQYIALCRHRRSS
jgi:hypothetical protein